MAMTGTKEVHPVKFGSPAIDYATGMTGAFALSAALFQRERTGRGQRIDMAMLDVAMILMSSHVTGYLRNGVHPKPHGNRHPHATNGAFATKDGLVMLGASNLRQQRRLWTVLGRPDMIKRTNDERDAGPRARGRGARGDHAARARPTSGRNSCRRATCRPRACAPWGRRSPIRRLRARRVIHRHDAVAGMEGGFGVPLAAFTFAHGGPQIDTAPPTLGQHNEEILRELARTRPRKVAASGGGGT